MMFVLIFVAGLALVAWLVAAVSCIRLFGMRNGRLSAGAMMFRGSEWFNPANFKPEAAGPRKMFIRAFIVFFVCIFAMAGLAMMLASKPA